MGISRVEPQNWFLIEHTYLKWIEEKTKIINDVHPAYEADKELGRCTVLATKEGEFAVREFYDIVVKYMCDKYPMIFEQRGKTIYNSITEEEIPFYAGTIDVYELMRYLVRTIDEDFIILLKDPKKQDSKNPDEYYFKAGVFAFAGGFNPKDKFDRPLSFIHEPIPGYEQKLKVLMNRFFARLKPGEFVTRSNFSVQTHNKFYVDDSNKGYHFEDEHKIEPYKFEDLDFNTQVHYRSERQVLTKLPKSKAVVFTIKTYLHPFSEFEEQSPIVAETLAGAIRGFPPDIAQYKNSVQWGPAALHYLDMLASRD